MNKRYLETNDAVDKVPTYDEIVHDSDDDLSEDEKTVNLQDEFEHKFNFRSGAYKVVLRIRTFRQPGS